MPQTVYRLAWKSCAQTEEHVAEVLLAVWVTASNALRPMQACGKTAAVKGKRTRDAAG